MKNLLLAGTAPLAMPSFVPLAPVDAVSSWASDTIVVSGKRAGATRLQTRQQR